MERQPNARGSGEQLRAQLVAAASELLLSPQAVALPSLRAVARACSVSPAAIYLHFDSVQELTAAVLDAQLDDMEGAITSRLPDAAPRVRLAALGAAYAQWGLSHPGAYQLVFESADRLDLPDRGHDRWSLIEEAARLVVEASGIVRGRRVGRGDAPLDAAARDGVAAHPQARSPMGRRRRRDHRSTSAPGAVGRDTALAQSPVQDAARTLAAVTVVGLLPREREERARLNGTALATVGAERFVRDQFADVDVCHALIVTPTADIGGMPR